MKTLKQKAKKEKKSSEAHIKNLQEYLLKAEKAETYAIERFDLLIISLSSGALVLSISLVKDIIKKIENKDLTLLKISWALFVLAIVLNLLSQVTGYYANRFDIKVTKECIRREEGKKPKKGMEDNEYWNWFLDNTTTLLNFLCLSVFIIGIVLLIRFMFLNI